MATLGALQLPCHRANTCCTDRPSSHAPPVNHSKRSRGPTSPCTWSTSAPSAPAPHAPSSTP
eukprot:351254-Lingulodinium_polyedra.AAC.1